MRHLLYFIAFFLILSSCKTNPLSLSVTEPAEISVPAYMKKIGVINRSEPTEETKKLNKLDDILTGEGPELDKAGAKEGLSGLADELRNNERFTEVKPLDNVSLKTTAIGVFPAALDWPTVDKICKENNVDAIFSLELFDTDSKISYTALPSTLSTPLGGIPVVEQEARMVTTVKMGWRIYDPKNRYVIDEHSNNENLTFTGRGLTPVAAAAGLIGRKDAVKQAANRAGHNYAGRILPYLIRVSREYYVKGNPDFTMAKRMARTANWNNAGELWKKETSNASPKLAARACYNMAIVSEINGDLDGAIDWAQKAYETGGKRMAWNYVNVLKNRRIRNNRLQNQEDQAK